ncbi:hypothetical protein BC751_0035 [Cecembia calidifontis]|uniref:Uncharacterized protein n=2 Tax=Cecembia calidifontis TaxID=1187080 RepID=A0A4Q7P4F1_9BACT|nr:hypothetical protein BC751_0035 [Cecembia calidifontis]
MITFLTGIIGIFKVGAQDASIPDSFQCIPFSLPCGGSGLACGFTEAERIQDAANWTAFYCGG